MRRPGCRRGVALLMVMIALVISAVLLTSFMATQGTAPGIARNDTAVTRARLAAESGLDMGLYLIESDATWRRDMTPGTWLNNYALNGGTVQLTAASDQGSPFNQSFTDYLTNSRNPNYGGSEPGAPPPVILTSTGTYQGISYTLRARLQSTGGGRPWRDGIFLQHTTSSELQHLDPLVDVLNTVTGTVDNTVDAIIGTNDVEDDSGGGGLLGGLLGGLTKLLGSLLHLNVQQRPSDDLRSVGAPVAPATDGFVAGGTGSNDQTVSMRTYVLQGGTYLHNLTGSSRGVLQVTSPNAQPVVVWVQNNMTLGSGAALQVADGTTAVFLVDGTLTLQGKVTLTGSGRAVFFGRGQITVDTGAQINPTQPSNRVVIVGGTPGMSLTFTGSIDSTRAVVFAPGVDVQMDENAVLTGSLVANSLTLSGNSVLHYDTASVDATYHSVTGGSYEGDINIITDRPGGPVQ